MYSHQSFFAFLGEVFNLKVLKTWEFNGTSPIRSMAFPLMTAGLPFHLLKYLATNYFQNYGNFINAYSLLVAPRIFMVFMSFCVDFFIFRICRNFGFHAMPSVMLFATSYVIMTYYQRTLSNATEAFLFADLIYNVSKHIRKVESITEAPKDGKRKSGKDKEKKAAKSQQVKKCGTCGGSFWIPVIIVAGTFNRPTFPAFALVPFLCWLLNDTDFVLKWTLIIKRLSLCVIVGSLTILGFTLVDSIYYGSMDPNIFFEGASSILAFIQSGKFIKNLTLTPLNFIKYNMDNRNLASHGTHPKYTHLLANLPMLFGPLATLILLDLFRLPAKASTEDKPDKNRNRILVYLSISIPVIILSIFPHQEPRFLIPLLIPVAVMYGSYLFGSGCYKSLCFIWILFNVSFAMFYGLLHQGGMFPCIQDLQQRFYNERNLGKSYHVIFYHTYMPPWHLFTLNKEGYVGFVQKPPKKVKQQLFLHDLAGSPPKILDEYIEKLVSPDMSKTEILLVSPSTIDALFCTWKNRKVYKFVKSYSHHLTMEDLPDFEHDIECQLGNVILENCNRDCRGKTLLEKVDSVLSLFVYKVEKVPEKKAETVKRINQQ